MGETAGESEQALVDAARGGDAAAIERLLALNQGRILRFAGKMCRNPEDAKDVLQETLLAAARGVRDFRGVSSVSTWMFTIARSFCIKKRRKGVFEPAHVASLDSEPGLDTTGVRDPARLPDDELHGRELSRALERAIGSLEPGYREVLVLRDVEGLTAPEVSEVLGIGVDAVKSRLHRARLAVRAELAPLLETPSAVAPSPGCPDVLGLLSRHLEDEISPDTCASMEQHLAGCARCRGACDSLRKTLALCRATPQEQVSDSLQESVRRAIRTALGERS